MFLRNKLRGPMESHIKNWLPIIPPDGILRVGDLLSYQDKALDIDCQLLVVGDIQFEVNERISFTALLLGRHRDNMKKVPVSISPGNQAYTVKLLSRA